MTMTTLLQKDATPESPLYADMARPKKAIHASFETVENFYARGGKPLFTIPHDVHKAIKELALELTLAEGIAQGFKKRNEKHYKRLRAAWLYSEGYFTKKAKWHAIRANTDKRTVLSVKQKAKGLSFDITSRLFAKGHREQALYIKDNKAGLSKRELAYNFWRKQCDKRQSAFTVMRNAPNKLSRLQAQALYEIACKNADTALQAWRKLCYAKVMARNTYTVNGVTYTDAYTAKIAQNRLYKQRDAKLKNALQALDDFCIRQDIQAMKLALADLTKVKILDLSSNEFNAYIKLKNALLLLIAEQGPCFTLQNAYELKYKASYVEASANLQTRIEYYTNV